MSMNLDVIFAAVVGVLAAIAVIGALVFVDRVGGLRDPGALGDHRRHTEQAETFWRDHATGSIPERP